MKGQTLLGTILVAALVSVSLGTSGAGAPAGPSAIPEQTMDPEDAIVVAMYHTLPEAPLADLETPATLDRTIPELHAAAFTVTAQDGDTLIDELAARPDVKGAFYPSTATLTYTPDDPLLANQWGAPAIGIETAWDTTLGSHTARVAVLDTGSDYDHPDLVPNLSSGDVLCGPDLNTFDEDAPAEDDHFHGSHVAGTVAAKIDNGIGVAGMSDSCVQTIKVCNRFGSCPSLNIAEGLVHATITGADIISMSLGGPGDPLMLAGVQFAHARGVLIIAAAGNSGCWGGSADTVANPGGYTEVMAVSALSSATTRAGFSSCGPDVEITAPGQSIISARFGGGYVYASGTSMATPHVSGIAGLVKSAHPAITAAQLRCVLTTTADDIGTAGHDIHFGHGRIDPTQALAAAGDLVASGCVVGTLYGP